MLKRSIAIAALALGSLALAGALGGEDDASIPTGGLLGSFIGSMLERAQVGDEPVHLRVPAHEPLRVAAAPHESPEVPSGALRAHSYQFVSRVFSRPAVRPHAEGFVRRGIVLEAGQRVRGPGCKGVWYALASGGVVCSSDGFAVGRRPRAPIAQRKPDVERALPYPYAKVTTSEALRFHRIPTEAEERQIARALEQGSRLPEVVHQRLDGVYLVALDRAERAGDRGFHRTVYGRYVREQDIELKQEPLMRGELLGATNRLPYAFVYGQRDGQAPVYRITNADIGLEPVGFADNHARMPVKREVVVGDQTLVVGPDGLALQRSTLRVASKTRRPSDVPEDAKWIHVDLDEQVLVAYEGDRPVFTTLVSSGKGEEFATPAGLYRIDEKHISTTMRGPDPDAGVYEVGEVPWTMYYDEGYALHGAYWHDSFGETRSHGCTNIAPIDARWLFYWSDGTLPPGWHALRNFAGTYVYLTDGRREPKSDADEGRLESTAAG